jgi:cytochrome b561
MYKSFAILLLSVCMIIIPISGCAVSTQGDASWELYAGFRTKQHSEEPAKITVESSVVDKIVDSLTDGEVSEAE